VCVHGRVFLAVPSHSGSRRVRISPASPALLLGVLAGLKNFPARFQANPQGEEFASRVEEFAVLVEQSRWFATKGRTLCFKLITQHSALFHNRLPAPAGFNSLKLTERCSRAPTSSTRSCKPAGHGGIDQAGSTLVSGPAAPQSLSDAVRGRKVPPTTGVRVPSRWMRVLCRRRE
jgi:hypothetical protein